MARQKNLDTVIKNERKYVHMIPSYMAFRSAGTRTVQLENGAYTQIDDPGLSIEKENPSSYLVGPYDPANPADKEILDAVEETLERQPFMATDSRFRLALVGEHSAAVWPGYEDQDAEALLNYWMAMPEKARPSLEGVMKYELERVDDEGNSITDQDKIKVLNELYRDQDKAAKVIANEKVDLS